MTELLLELTITMARCWKIAMLELGNALRGPLIILELLWLWGIVIRVTMMRESTIRDRSRLLILCTSVGLNCTPISEPIGLGHTPEDLSCALDYLLSNMLADGL